MATAEFSPLDIIGTILKILSQLFFRWTSLEPCKNISAAVFPFLFLFLLWVPQTYQGEQN